MTAPAAECKKLSASEAPDPGRHHVGTPGDIISECPGDFVGIRILTAFRLSDRNYGLNQLRYDLRKLKGHGLLERDGSRYAYRLTAKGVQVALLFFSSINASADRLPIAVSTTNPTPTTVQTAGSKPPTTAPTKPSKRLSMCSRPRNNVELFLSMIFEVRI